ncbi:threonine-phosphate decarboxylase CobD [Pueribacillus theae]|uniref:threonine-phosphate decarboxylase CobD n=1 Tax=Pueribacillus theae TaxID=2171751 RepID=UPI001402161B|nr:threonine-phosphate decarboxylase CobD [Pueribacillus theae]
MSLPAHGSNPKHLLQALQVESPNHHLIDFSVNVNPFGMPASIRAVWNGLLASIADYPDPESMALKIELAKRESIGIENMMIGNGAAELVFLLANAFRGKDILIVDPTFSEYRSACEAHGCRVHSYQLREENGWRLDVEEIVQKLPGKAALFICNPNNPTGIRYEKESVITMIEKAEEHHVMVIIDEAFYDFCDEPYTLIPYIEKFSNLAVLRSFTKMFAIPGIRLGWLAASKEMMTRFSKLKPHWSVNAVAEQIGIQCLAEDTFVEQSVIRLKNERQRVTSALKEMNFVLSNSNTNYYLLREHEKQNLETLLRFLIKEGITARHTENFIGLDGNYLRFAVRKHEENNVLLEALESWRNQCSSS